METSEDFYPPAAFVASVAIPAWRTEAAARLAIDQFLPKDLGSIVMAYVQSPLTPTIAKYPKLRTQLEEYHKKIEADTTYSRLIMTITSTHHAFRRTAIMPNISFLEIPFVTINDFVQTTGLTHLEINGSLVPFPNRSRACIRVLTLNQKQSDEGCCRPGIDRAFSNEDLRVSPERHDISDQSRLHMLDAHKLTHAAAAWPELTKAVGELPGDYETDNFSHNTLLYATIPAYRPPEKQRQDMNGLKRTCAFLASRTPSFPRDPQQHSEHQDEYRPVRWHAKPKHIKAANRGRHNQQSQHD